MQEPRRHRGGALVALAVALAGCLWMAAGTRGAGAATPAASGDPTSSCPWGRSNNSRGGGAAYPDTAAHYFTVAIPAVPGETLTLHGTFPHARYISFTTYDPKTAAADNVNDQGIVPDAGGVNPYLADADRTATRRAFTLDVVFGQRPASGAPRNTLYTTSQDGSHIGPAFIVIYRVYRPDTGRDETGDGGLPRITVNDPGGARQELAGCPGGPADAQPDAIGQANNKALSGDPLVSSPLQGPGLDPPIWRKFYNLAESLVQGTDNGVVGSAASDGAQPVAAATGSGGFLQNLDNNYIATVLGAGYGQVVVVHGHVWGYVPTYQRQPRMAAATLRYWSVCSNEEATTRVYACLDDDQVVSTGSGDWTLVVSTAANRPRNATAACGVNWLPFGAAPDDVLIIRNMLAQPGVTGTVQATRAGHEVEDLGRYYPRSAYTSTSAFEQLGCVNAQVAATSAGGPPPAGSVATAGPGGLPNTAASGSARDAAGALGLLAFASVMRGARRRHLGPWESRQGRRYSVAGGNATVPSSLSSNPGLCATSHGCPSRSRKTPA